MSENGSKQYKTRLNPPPAKGWVPPPLPPLEDLVQPTFEDETKKSRRGDSTRQSQVATADPKPKMANLFEEAPKTLFDEIEESEEPETPTAPVPLGRVTVNGKPAQLIGKKALPNGATEFQVILQETGEVKKYVSPPARVEEE